MTDEPEYVYTYLIHEVFSVTATANPEVYSLDIDMTYPDGSRVRTSLTSGPNDPYGAGPDVRHWLQEYEGAYEIIPYLPPVLGKTELTSYAANARWIAENGGFRLGDMLIASDDRSKTMIIGARVKADGDPDFTTRWKGPDGSFTTIDAATIILISDAMLQHVADCFAAEAEVVTAIDAGEITTTEQVDVMIASAISQQQTARG